MTNTASKTSIWENGLIWFGAALSIAEIQTGTFFAPLGLEKGLMAILLGHLIGCGLLFGAGVIGGKTGKSAMETVKMSFGRQGGRLFALLNILQLLGWTGIMIYEGALAAGSLFGTGEKLWCLLLGGLIMLWLVIGLKKLGKLNAIAMGALLLLTLLSTVTTTFLDAYSAGVSSQSLSKRFSEKAVALFVTLLGTAGAIFLPLLDFTEFLYFIGSVFAPMIAIQLADFFVTGRRYEHQSFSRRNLLLWLTGFILYRLLMLTDLPVGSTIPAMLVTMALCIGANLLQDKQKPVEA